MCFTEFSKIPVEHWKALLNIIREWVNVAVGYIVSTAVSPPYR